MARPIAILINCNSFENLFGLVDLISDAVRHGICRHGIGLFKRAIATKVQVVIILYCLKYQTLGKTTTQRFMIYSAKSSAFNTENQASNGCDSVLSCIIVWSF